MIFVCPILLRFGHDRTECPAHTHCTYSVERSEVTVCWWANWHQLDPNTGKPPKRIQPAPAPAQGSLFS